MNETFSKSEWEGKYIVLKATVMKPQYQDLKQRIVLCQGGFGASPFLHGKAVFVKFVADGVETRFNRADFERFATDEEVISVRR